MKDGRNWQMVTPVLRQRNWRVGFRLTRRYGPLSPSKESASKPATALLQSVVSIMDAVEHSKHKTTADNTAGRENKHPQGVRPRAGVFRRVCASDAARGSDRPPPHLPAECAQTRKAVTCRGSHRPLLAAQRRNTLMGSADEENQLPSSRWPTPTDAS